MAELAVIFIATLDEEDVDVVPVEDVLANCWAVTSWSFLVPNAICLAAKTSDLRQPRVDTLLTLDL